MVSRASSGHANVFLLWPVCLAWLSAYAWAQQGTLELLILNGFGEEAQGQTYLRLENKENTRTVTLDHPRESIELPFGRYILSCGNGSSVCPSRLIEVRQPHTQAILTLVPRNPPIGDGYALPWVVTGRVVPRRSGRLLVARILGLNSGVSQDAQIKDDGSFTIYVWWISSYKLWVLGGGKRLAEKSIDIDHDTPKNLGIGVIQLPK